MISIVYDVLLYRRLLAETVREGDIVVEIGPHTGKSTLGYAGKAKLAVAVDKSPEAEKSFRPVCLKHRNVRFLRGDVRGFETLAKVLKITPRCDVLAVDIGGGRYSNCSMLEAIELCEQIAGRKLNWTYSEQNRQGDHMWWISDNGRFMGHYPEWRLTYNVPLILQEIYEYNVERWAELVAVP